MALQKHDIPILEYDDTPTAVIMPDRHHRYCFPEYAVFPFLGDEVERFAAESSCEKIGEFVSATKLYPIFGMTYKGREICLCQAPVGAAAAVQLLEYLIGYGAGKIISAGSCGALRPYGENVFLIPTEALRCEGTSYHYLPPSRTVSANPAAVRAVEAALTERGIPWQHCRTWTTDGFYRETAAMVEYRKAEGFSVVEMECAALFACARFRGAKFAQILYTADTLANTDAHDDRDWGAASVPLALKLCLDAVVRM